MKASLRAFVTVAVAVALGASVQSSEAACIAGGVVDDINDCLQASNGSKDCLMAWAVDFDGAGGPPPDEKTIVCRDGDPCDRDGHANGVCTFHVGACLNTNVAGCSTATLSNMEFKKPGEKDATTKAAKTPDAFFARRALLDEVDALLPVGAETCSVDNIEIRVPLKRKSGICNSPAGDKCSSDQDCDDYCVPTYKKGKASLKASVDDGGSNKDSDSFKFFCEPPDFGGSPACTEAFQITSASDLIGGPMAQGRVGDWMLRNGQVRVLVRDVGRAHSFMVTYGGHILDADIVRENPADDRDHFTGIQTAIHLSASQNTDTITVLNDGSNCEPAILRTSGPDDLFDVLSPEVAIFSAGNTLSIPLDTVDNNLPLNLTTDYIISPHTNYVEVATTVENTGGSDLNLTTGDYLNGGGELEMFGPGVGYGEALLRKGGSGSAGAPQGLDFLGWSGTRNAVGVSYGLVFPRSFGQDSNGKTVDGTFNTGAFVQSGVGAWVNGQDLLGVLNAPPTNKPTPPFLVPAGGENTFRRWFVAAETINDVTRAREDLFGNKLGLVQGTVTLAGTPVGGARIAILRGVKGNRCLIGSPCVNIFSATTTDSQGFYRAWLPADDYQVHVRVPGAPFEGGASTSPGHSVKVKAKKAAIVDVDVPETGSLRVLVADHAASPIAGKVSVVGFEASPDPLTVDSIAGFIDSIGRYFGYEVEERGTDTFGIRTTLFADHGGDTGTHNLEPGTYHVVVSHGPEYDVYDEAITITAGATTTVNATVNQVVDSTGFVSIDTHVHSLPSADSNVSLERRIISMLAEGVDFFANTDHDSVHDMADDIAALGATGLVANAPGNELTTFSYGHYNMWPLTVDTGSIIGGAFDWGDASSPVGAGYPSDGEYDIEPASLFAAFNPATQVIQANHFNSATLGFFRNLGVDTEAIPPVSTNQAYRCTGGTRAGLPCQAALCIGGTSDGIDCAGGGAGTCTGGGGVCNSAPLGRGCPGGTCTDTGNLAQFLRLDPALTNLYDDGYTALELWIESGRAQTELALTDNLADWAGLLNQGIFKTAIADSDTHWRTVVPSGSPRTWVASATDDPGSIVATDLAMNVNAGRAFGSNSIFMDVSLEGDAAAIASHRLGDPLTVDATLGLATLHIHLESADWAEFDTVEIYTNTPPECVTGFNFLGAVDRECDLTPDATLVEGIDFTLVPTAGVSGFGTRLVTTPDIAHPLVIGEDTWVVVVARGTDGVSKPLFPMIGVDLPEKVCVGSFNPGDPCIDNGDCIFGSCDVLNGTLSDLTDGGVSPPWNLDERGVLATAFSNPLFADFEGDGFCHGGTACP